MSSIFDSLHLVEPHSEEYDVMWEKLKKNKLNKGFESPAICENYGETWQYMETSELRAIFGIKKVRHVFRHRMHPQTQNREYIEIPVTREYKQIHFKKAGKK